MGRIIPYIRENNKCSKPPLRFIPKGVHLLGLERQVILVINKSKLCLKVAIDWVKWVCPKRNGILHFGQPSFSRLNCNFGGHSPFSDRPHSFPNRWLLHHHILRTNSQGRRYVISPSQIASYYN